jgi:putative ABC transport system permease protein
MKIEVVKGRSLDQKYASDTIFPVVINETAQKLMNMKEPIGKELIIKQKRKLKIIGVVKDFNLLSPEVEVSGMYLSS